MQVATFSPDGKLVLTAAFGGTVKIWTADGEEIATLEYGAPVYCGGFSPDGSYVFAGGYDRIIRIWPNPAPLAERWR